MIWTGVLHYTTSAPWPWWSTHSEPGPVERFAVDAGLPVTRRSADFRKRRRRDFLRTGLAPLRALAFPVVSVTLPNLGGKKRSVQVIEKRRGIGSTIFSTRRAGGDCTIDAPRKFNV